MKAVLLACAGVGAVSGTSIPKRLCRIGQLPGILGAEVQNTRRSNRLGTTALKGSPWWRGLLEEETVEEALPLRPGECHASSTWNVSFSLGNKFCFSPRREDIKNIWLHSYDMISSQAIITAQHASVQHSIWVCTKLVEPFQAQLGSLYLILGETECGEGEKIIVKARIFTCVEGINLQLLENAIDEQRKYFQERMKNPGGNTSS